MTFLYSLLRWLNSANAVSRNRVPQRVARVGVGRLAGRVMRRIR